ncbi:hypothetical protein J6590_037194 [Homalodisca vitripennis]|nr:hypothetical protein J6590_037194 [Homalodisca vitripennis]
MRALLSLLQYNSRYDNVRVRSSGPAGPHNDGRVALPSAMPQDTDRGTTAVLPVGSCDRKHGNHT